MLPSLSPLSDSRALDAKVSVPPPPRFRALQGVPRNISLKPSPYAHSLGITAAQRAGLRYETKAQGFLSETLGKAYASSPAIHFQDASGFRTAIPDGILVHFGSRPRDQYSVVFEIKSQHCPEAWWQLTQLYRPLIEAHRKQPVFVVEVVRSYDPAMPFPCRIDLIADIVAYCEEPTSDFGVFKWRPQ